MSSSNQQQLLLDINKELTYVKRWCDINKLSINFKKTNFMIIKSARKKLSVQFNVKLPCEGSDYILEQKDSIKYLGVMIDDKLNWNKHVSLIASRISRNTSSATTSPQKNSAKSTTLSYIHLPPMPSLHGAAQPKLILKSYKPDKII